MTFEFMVAKGESYFKVLTLFLLIKFTYKFWDFLDTQETSWQLHYVPSGQQFHKPN